jgi:hypothetical protein
MLARMAKSSDHHGKKESAQRMDAAVRRMFAMPYKPQAELKGVPGPRGVMQRRRRAKERRAS